MLSYTWFPVTSGSLSPLMVTYSSGKASPKEARCSLAKRGGLKKQKYNTTRPPIPPDEQRAAFRPSVRPFPPFPPSLGSVGSQSAERPTNHPTCGKCAITHISEVENVCLSLDFHQSNLTREFCSLSRNHNMSRMLVFLILKS